MAYVTKTVSVTAEWTFITNKVALLQFNDRMQMAITSGSTPTSSTAGFMMEEEEKYINSTAGVSVWAKAIPNNGSGRESVRVAENA